LENAEKEENNRDFGERYLDFVHHCKSLEKLAFVSTTGYYWMESDQTL
jgi:hypothetical protein